MWHPEATINMWWKEITQSVKINIEDDILKQALAQNTSNKMKSIIQTIQKEQNTIIRGSHSLRIL